LKGSKRVNADRGPFFQGIGGFCLLEGRFFKQFLIVTVLSWSNNIPDCLAPEPLVGAFFAGEAVPERPNPAKG
jgi:hypothetical protein